MCCRQEPKQKKDEDEMIDKVGVRRLGFDRGVKPKESDLTT